jgi:hypothetical protein
VGDAEVISETQLCEVRYAVTVSCESALERPIRTCIAPCNAPLYLEHLHGATAKTAYGKIFGTRVCNLLGPTKFVVGALAEMLSAPPRKIANVPEVCAHG